MHYMCSLAMVLGKQENKQNTLKEKNTWEVKSLSIVAGLSKENIQNTSQVI